MIKYTDFSLLKYDMNHMKFHLSIEVEISTKISPQTQIMFEKWITHKWN